MSYNKIIIKYIIKNIYRNNNDIYVRKISLYKYQLYQKYMNFSFAQKVLLFIFLNYNKKMLLFLFLN